MAVVPGAACVLVVAISKSAHFSTRVLTTKLWPWAQAWNSGVLPFLSCRLMYRFLVSFSKTFSKSRFSKYLVNITWPWIAAKWIGALPFLSMSDIYRLGSCHNGFSLIISLIRSILPDSVAARSSFIEASLLAAVIRLLRYYYIFHCHEIFQTKW